jgi:hypothetical protein
VHERTGEGWIGRTPEMITKPQIHECSGANDSAEKIGGGNERMNEQNEHMND